MKHFLQITLFLCMVTVSAQPVVELTPQGFEPVAIKTPDSPLDQLMELSKSWASHYNKKGYDIVEVTENSLTIEALNQNAFYYYNVGVKYNHDIRYTLKIVFGENRQYSLAFRVKDIYAENVLLKTTVTDFFTPDGKLKDDFRDAKPSLEKTVNDIVRSFAVFIDR